jgi:hypothetical protein
MLLQTGKRPDMKTFVMKTHAKLAVTTALAMFALTPAAVAAHMSGHPNGGAHFHGGSAGVPHAAVAHPIMPVPHHNAGGFKPGGGIPQVRHFNGGGGGNAAWHHEQHANHEHHDNHHGHHHRNFFVYGVPYYDTFDDYAYTYNGGDCGYYWRRYQQTGNPLWKHRYQDCVG